MMDLSYLYRLGRYITTKSTNWRSLYFFVLLQQSSNLGNFFSRFAKNDEEKNYTYVRFTKNNRFFFVKFRFRIAWSDWLKKQKFLSIYTHFGTNNVARAMGKRAQFSFMFTESTAKHIYDSVASIGFYYYCINTHTQHGTYTHMRLWLSGSVFVFLQFQPVPFCCRLFCQWNYAYFSPSHSLSLALLPACERFFLRRSFVAAMHNICPRSHTRSFTHFTLKLSLIHYVFAFCFARWTPSDEHTAMRHTKPHIMPNLYGIASAAVCVQIHGRIELLRWCMCACSICMCVRSVRL